MRPLAEQGAACYWLAAVLAVARARVVRDLSMPNGLAVSSLAGRQPATVMGRYLL